MSRESNPAVAAVSANIARWMDEASQHGAPPDEEVEEVIGMWLPPVLAGTIADSTKVILKGMAEGKFG